MFDIIDARCNGMFESSIVQQILFTEILFNVDFKCNLLFNCRLEIKNVVLREIFGGKMEKLTGGWREL